MSLLGIRLEDLPQRREQVPRDWGSWGYQCFVLGPATAQRWTPGCLEPRPRVLPSGDWNAPGIGLLGLCISASLSATPGSWGLRASGGSIQTRSLVRSLRSRVPDLALGARSRPLSPGLRRPPRPNPLSPGGFCSLRPRSWPSGPATLQTWAGFRSRARSLPPPLTRCLALTWKLSSQLRVIFSFLAFLGQSFPNAAAGSGLALRPSASAGGEGKWVCAWRRVSGTHSTWFPSARASPALGCSVLEHSCPPPPNNFFILESVSVCVEGGVEQGASLAPPHSSLPPRRPFLLSRPRHRRGARCGHW